MRHRMLLTMLAFLFGVVVAWLALRQSIESSPENKTKIRQYFAKWDMFYKSVDSCDTQFTFQVKNETMYLGAEVSNENKENDTVQFVAQIVDITKTAGGIPGTECPNMEKAPIKAPSSNAKYWKLKPGTYRMKLLPFKEGATDQVSIKVFSTRKPTDWQKSSGKPLTDAPSEK